MSKLQKRVKNLIDLVSILREDHEVEKLVNLDK